MKFEKFGCTYVFQFVVNQNQTAAVINAIPFYHQWKSREFTVCNHFPSFSLRIIDINAVDKMLESKVSYKQNYGSDCKLSEHHRALPL